VAPFGQICSQIQEIVDLAVENDSQQIKMICHGLGPSGRKVNNRQAAMSEANLQIARPPQALTIGSTVA